MWKSLMNAVLESFASCDPVVYVYYLESKRETERQAEVTPYRAPLLGAVMRPVDEASRARREVSA